MTTPEILSALKAIEDKLTRTPTAFRWTPEMQSIWPREMRPTMSGLLAIWEAMRDAAEYSVVGASTEQPAHPDGDVVGACVCGSWPGGKCLRCPRIDGDGWIENKAFIKPAWLKDGDLVQYRMRGSTKDCLARASSLDWDQIGKATVTHWRLVK